MGHPAPNLWLALAEEEGSKLLKDHDGFSMTSNRSEWPALPYSVEQKASMTAAMLW